MLAVAHEKFLVEWGEFLPDAKLNERMDELVREKFSRTAYNRKR